MFARRPLAKLKKGFGKMLEEAGDGCGRDVVAKFFENFSDSDLSDPRIYFF